MVQDVRGLRPYKNRIGGKGRDVAQMLCTGAALRVCRERQHREIPTVCPGVVSADADNKGREEKRWKETVRAV